LNRPGDPAVLFVPDRGLLRQTGIRCSERRRPARILEGEDRHKLLWGGRVPRFAERCSQRPLILAKPGQTKDLPTVEFLITLNPKNPKNTHCKALLLA
jgi:hypothetical protein